MTSAAALSFAPWERVEIFGRNAFLVVDNQLELTLHDEDLFAADEAFLTGTTRELVPIVTVDDRTIGSGKPGPVTLQLLAAFRQSTQV